MLIMSQLKRLQPNVHSKKVGKPTTKKTGPVSTSIYLQAEDNKLFRGAAALEGISFNGWAIDTLRRAAKAVHRKHGKADE
jgi:uncharacterized protein (DUF1778 family)